MWGLKLQTQALAAPCYQATSSIGERGPEADATFLIPRDNNLGITVDVLNNQTPVTVTTWVFPPFP